jgi:hypothetical protein
MKYLLEGATDAGAMLFFDPGALPDDYDARSGDDPMADFGPLIQAGELYRLDTGGDGEVSLGVHRRRLARRPDLTDAALSRGVPYVADDPA